ncbi:FecCD family ABC transporter permease [Vibrio porteresiae]|uniref:Iron ABC transporter permease n=1 Tax=Vibrio porteresiae DSM 19223 TaxID=1123496 RepID=A0ABZ0QMY2_9VIBR|nr:iron ABC transporter permease [Vibrio porteresiae]WPC76771.1 iron ABC transporter permease [Vibrio porteresiae DSM 19223]
MAVHSKALTAVFMTLGLLSVLLLMVLAARIGDVPVSFEHTWMAITNGLGLTDYPLSPLEQGIIWQYRMSRALMAACSGAGLALCGVILQALLRNSLAEPYLLGISAGASTGAVLVMLLGVGGGLISVSGGAFIGACASFLVIMLLARGLSFEPSRIILAGIAGTQLFNALTAYLVSTSANAEQSRSVMFWLLGSLSSVRWPEALMALIIVIPAFLLLLLFARRLDTLALGEDIARTLGTHVTLLRVVLLVITALITAVMVSTIGAVGFIGLVIPHIARFVVGHQHLKLLPAAALIGALFMILADIASRTLVAHQVLPIGVVTALVGSPVFAFILYRSRGKAA